MRQSFGKKNLSKSNSCNSLPSNYKNSADWRHKMHHQACISVCEFPNHTIINLDNKHGMTPIYLTSHKNSELQFSSSFLRNLGALWKSKITKLRKLLFNHQNNNLLTAAVSDWTIYQMLGEMKSNKFAKYLKISWPLRYSMKSYYI